MVFREIWQIHHDPRGDCTHFKIMKFSDKNTDATSALRSFLADFNILQKLMTGAIRTDNGVAERAVGLLREKTIALMQDLKEGNNDRLSAEAMNYAYDLTNMSRTTSNDDIISPYENGTGRRLRWINGSLLGRQGTHVCPQGNTC